MGYTIVEYRYNKTGGRAEMKKSGYDARSCMYKQSLIISAPVQTEVIAPDGAPPPQV